MKIQMIRLIAYGPFTGSVLDLSTADANFHMVYGPNEAGKSSALRALRSMLFGMPVRTPDSFLHPNPRLRIGARLLRSDGAQIEFIRRKAQLKTLRGPDDETLLEDDSLIPFLGGVGQELFEQMFAIGHSDLVAGGQEIVSGGGRVGEALFAAGAGLIRLQSVQQGLEQACEALFKPAGSRPRINSVVLQIKDARKSQKETLLPAKTWKTHHQALGDAQQRLETVLQRLVQLKQTLSRLERIHQALPLIARKKEIDAQLLDFEGAPELPENFSDIRRKTENEFANAKREYSRIEETIQSLNLQKAALPVPEALLGQAALVEDLHQELGAFRAGQKDRPDREGRMRTLKKQASDKLSEIGKGSLADSGEKLRLDPAMVAEIQDMGATFERLTTRLDTARDQAGRLGAQICRLRAQREPLKVPPDTTALRVALEAAQDAGPLERQMTQALATLESREKALENTVERLPLWSGSAEDLDRLCCPSRESVDRFEKKFSETLREMERLTEEKRSARQQIRQIETDLKAIELSHDVPTEIDLERSRAIRESGWRLIRERLEGGSPPAEALDRFVHGIEPGAGLPDAYEKSVYQADRVADRLRREVEQVSRKGMLEAGKRRREQDLETLDLALGVLQKDRVELDGQWERLWVPAGVKPLSPAEMRVWLSEVESIREKLAEVRSEKTRTGVMASEIDLLKSQLIKALIDAGASLAGDLTLAKLIRVAKVEVDSRESLRFGIESLEKEILDHRSGRDEIAAIITDLENRLHAWRNRWRKIVETIGLDADAAPASAMAVIATIREAKALIDEADVLRKRIEGIDRDADAFRRRVEGLVAELAPDLKNEPPDAAALLLNARLTRARDLMSKKTGLERQLTAAMEERKAVQRRIEDSAAEIHSLCTSARCEKPEDLETAERRSLLRQQLIVRREELENRLRGLGAGATVEEFIRDAGTIDADGISQEIEESAKAMDILEKERSEIDRAIGAEKAELKRMDGSAAAAGYAEEAERLLGVLESDVEQYATLRVASAILARTIERHREKHQGPLIERASALFSRMTLGSFSGVRAEYDDKGKPVLAGIRPDGGQPVVVAGMSDGTADQLYLALRLASLEQYLQNSEPLPFIVDDILLRFDNERATATLEVLSELAEKTQVIFFTHHHHLVRLAEDRIDPSKLFQHRLSFAKVQG